MHFVRDFVNIDLLSSPDLIFTQIRHRDATYDHAKHYQRRSESVKQSPNLNHRYNILSVRVYVRACVRVCVYVCVWHPVQLNATSANSNISIQALDSSVWWSLWSQEEDQDC